MPAYMCQLQPIALCLGCILLSAVDHRQGVCQACGGSLPADAQAVSGMLSLLQPVWMCLCKRMHC